MTQTTKPHPDRLIAQLETARDAHLATAQRKRQEADKFEGYAAGHQRSIDDLKAAQ